MALAFYLDEDVPHELAGALRAIAYEANSVKELGALGLTDARQLLKAVDLGRTVITYNSKDFKLLHETLSLWSNRWRITADAWHHGILILPHLPVSELVPIINEFASQWFNIENRLFVWDRRSGWQEIV